MTDNDQPTTGAALADELEALFEKKRRLWAIENPNRREVAEINGLAASIGVVAMGCETAILAALRAPAQVDGEALDEREAAALCLIAAHAVTGGLSSDEPIANSFADDRGESDDTWNRLFTRGLAEQRTSFEDCHSLHLTDDGRARIDAIARPTPAPGDEAVRLLEALAEREALYRKAHDLRGADNMATGRAWDAMRKAGDKARAYLALPRQ